MARGSWQREDLQELSLSSSSNPQTKDSRVRFGACRGFWDAGLPQQVTEQAFLALDTDGSGEIDYSEFLATCRKLPWSLTGGEGGRGSGRLRDKCLKATRELSQVHD